MTEKTDKPGDKLSKANWTGAATMAGAAIGSAALAAALLYASRRKERLEKNRPAPPSPEKAPETD